ncbi:hypothetical protein [Halobacterium bonnevillei]|uniref:Uncharacterized protein n=1 Tax=Halobacterium bonnevillei TaxID=2692200 RepID=A0A6B0SPS1_9EURY|nr:hypothetical protein [Halobacterium bonnevillei]MXR21523.1 hypothetical protein [Halobacterium bonnevillei]
MNDATKVGIAAVLLGLSSILLFWSGFSSSESIVLLVAAALATTGLAAGSLLMGSTGSDGRMV